MLSSKVLRVLKKYEITVPPEMAENDAWGLVRHHERKSQKPKAAVSVCFTGFTSSTSEELQQAAESAGFAVNLSVAKSTTHLCCGPLGAGPSKTKKAEEQGVRLLTEDQFRHMLETGEIL